MRKAVNATEVKLIYDGTKSAYPKGVTIFIPAGAAGLVYVTAGEKNELERSNLAGNAPAGGFGLAAGNSSSYTYFQDKLYARSDVATGAIDIEVQDYRMFDWVQHYIDLFKGMTGQNKLRESGTSPQSHA